MTKESIPQAQRRWLCSIKCRLQTADCRQQFYKQAFSFATATKDKKTHKYPAVSLDLTPSCTPQELTNTQLQIRQKLIDTITLYADAIQTLANGTDDTDLSKNSQDLARNIQGIAKQQGFTAVTASDTAAVNTAVETSYRQFWCMSVF